MFFGTFEHSIDEKGRVNVPAKFRDTLRASGDDRLFITNFVFQNVHCLDVYPPAAWFRFLGRVQERPQLDPRIINVVQNYYLAGTQECQIDRQGRILIPPRLRDYAGLKKDAIFAGALEKFRIWDRDSFGPVSASGEQTLIENPNILTELGL
jgi:MraZ protein